MQDQRPDERDPAAETAREASASASAPEKPPEKPPAREAILDAAIAEFSAHGFSGVRIEHVAARAGYNKSLVYRYYGDRDGLFRAALRKAFEGRSRMLDEIPPSLADILAFWFLGTQDDPHFMRLIQHEALSDTGAPLVDEDYRRAYYQRQIGMVEALQAQGALDPRYDATMLFLALQALVVYPAAFPTITRLVTGDEPGSERFREGWTSFLRALAEGLAAGDGEAES